MNKTVIKHSTSTPFSSCVYTLLSAAGILGTILCFYVPLGFSSVSSAIWGGGAGLLVCLVAFCLPKGKLVFTLSAAGVYLIAVLIFWQQLMLGASFAAQTMVAHFTTVFPEVGVVELPTGWQGVQACGIFMFFVSALVAVYLAWATLWRNSFLLCLLGSLPFFAFTFNLYGLPHSVGALLLFCCWIALLVKGQAGYHRVHPSAKVSLGAFALSAVYIASIFILFPLRGYTANPDIFNTRDNITNWKNTLQLYSPFESEGLGLPGAPFSGRANQVDLNTVGNLRFGKNNVLRIKGDFSKGYYLRGFSSTEYTGSAWLPLEKGGYTPPPLSFDPLIYTPFSSGSVTFLSPVPNGEIQIKNIGASNAYAYTPYFLQSLQRGNSGFSFVQDSYIKPSWGTTGYTATVNYGGIWNPNYFFSNKGPEYSITTTTVDNGRTVLALSTNDEPTVLFDFGEYSGKDSAYIDYIQAAYTQLPPGLASTMQNLARKQSIPLAQTKEDWIDTVYQVAEYVKNAAVYTQQPGNQPAEEDFVTYFLTQSKKGYCMHFASAAVVMLRALGVPARYVEGFIITKNPKNATQWMEIPAKNAHAWAEVWVPDLGWIPVEATPGGADAQQGESNETGGASGVTSSSSKPISASSSATVQISSSRATGTKAKQMPLAQRILLWSLGSILVVVFALVLIYAQTYTRRRRNFAQADKNKAALVAYHYLVQLKPFGYTPTDAATVFAGKARFSQHVLTATERDYLLQEAAAARVATLKMLPLYKKIWFFICAL